MIAEALLLAGYCPLVSHGFALPCFASAPQANTWYVAKATLDSDNRSAIAGFELVDIMPSDIKILAPEKQVRLDVGSRWYDVFLWNGDVFVGTPDDLIRQMEGVAREVQAAAPLSYLDLILSGDGPEFSKAIAVGRDFLAERWGEKQSEYWFAQVFLPQTIQNEVARRLGRKTAKFTHGGLKVQSITPNNFRTIIPRPLAQELADKNSDGLDIFSALSERLGVSIVPEEAEEEEAAHSATTHERPALRAAPEPALGRKNILIVAPDKLGQQVGGLIGGDDWTISVEGDDPLQETYRVRSSIGAPQDFQNFTDVRSIDVVRSVARIRDLSPYSVVVLLFNAATALDALDDEIATIHKYRGRSDIILVGAPVLFRNGPGQIFSDLLEPGTRIDSLKCLIDTSLVRSPFWTASSKRSLDRQVADLIVVSALNCAVNPALRSDLMRQKGPVGLLSLAWGSRSASLGSPALLSENNGELDVMGRPSTGQMFEFEVLSSRLSKKGLCNGLAKLSRLGAGFQGFADVFIHKAISRSVSGNIRRIDLPEKIAGAFSFPRSVAAFQFDEIGERAEPVRFLVTAETPSLDSIEQASRLGWSVARYTDRATITTFMSETPAAKTPVLPAEVLLPRLKRRAENDGLATRGVDPRDVAKLPSEAFEKIDSGAGDYRLSALARHYRESIDRASPTVIVPLKEFYAERIQGNLFAREVLDEAQRAGGWDGRPPPSKRLGDLYLLWAAVSDNVRRFAILDGQLPARIIELEPAEVPAQNMFVIVGDAAVPTLFNSRLFYAWARATTAPSTGWPSRFAMGNTFETFPLPDIFEVDRGDADRPAALTIGRKSDEVYDLIASLSANPVLTRREPWSNGDHELDITRAIDDALLKSVGLESEASDFEVLKRLVAINAQA